MGIMEIRCKDGRQTELVQDLSIDQTGRLQLCSRNVLATAGQKITKHRPCLRQSRQSLQRVVTVPRKCTILK
jgi:hypothetical protein